jgi:hypothetical protein
MHGLNQVVFEIEGALHESCRKTGTFTVAAHENHDVIVDVAWIIPERKRNVDIYKESEREREREGTRATETKDSHIYVDMGSLTQI